MTFVISGFTTPSPHPHPPAIENPSLVNMMILLVVIVTGGIHARTSVELLSSNGTRLCSLPNLPAGRYRHSQAGLVACGGDTSEMTSCVTFSAGSWKKTHALGSRVFGHTAWASPRGVLLMGGRYGMSTTKLLMDNGQTSPSFNLANNRWLHCGIEDGEEVVLTGGYSRGTVKQSTVTRYNIQGRATPLPSLNTARLYHACGRFKKSDGATVSQ